MPVYERLSLVISLTLIGLALYFIIDLPTQLFQFDLFGLPVTIVASQRLLMVVLLGGLAFTGTGAVIRSHPAQRTPYTVPFWVNATLIVILATLTLAQLGSPFTWAIGLLVTGALLWFTILAEYYVIEGHETFFSLGQLWSQWVSYALLLVYTILIYEAQLALIINVLSIATLTWFLGLSIFKLYRPANNRIGQFSFLVALGVGQITLVLHYWRLSRLGVGILTFLIFYLLCGVIISYWQDKLSSRIVVEYGLVATIGLWIIIQFVR